MPIKKWLAFSLLLIALVGLSGCSSSEKSDKKITINYSAAASLKNALTEIQKDYQAEHPNLTINLDFASSGAIREKVIAGAPIDGVFLASKSDADKLLNQKKAEDSKALLSNSLVLVTNKKSDFSSSTDLETVLKSAKKIAIGHPTTVPAGKYAEESLTKLGLLDQLQDKFIQGSDVTQVLSYAASGNVDLAFVYQTDAQSNQQVKILTTVPENLHSKINYYSQTISDSKQKDAVQAFNDYLADSKAQKIFKKYGFN